MATANIAKRWRDLSGQNHWNGLLKPLDKDLQTYMLHYGDMVEATYLTFIREAASRFAGSSAYPTNTLLNVTGMVHQSAPLMKYTVTKYIYGMSKFDLPFMVNSAVENPWTKQSNWMGYVAVATDEGKAVLGRRDIVVAWRGTLQPIEWAKDFDGHFTPATVLNDKTALMHAGFYSIYTDSDPKSSYNKTSARDQALAEVNRLINQYKAEDLSLTTCGHSLGGAICVINAADLAMNAAPASKPYPVTSFPFAGPRAGNPQWKNVCDRLGAATNSSVLSAGTGNLRVLRIVNRPDLVPNSPPSYLGFAHVGQEFLLDASFSSIIQNPLIPGIAHDMEASYQHGISISKGSLLLDGGSDEPADDAEASYEDEISTAAGSEALDGQRNVSGRDIALMNRHQDAVKPQYCIAPEWWTAENKGMVQLPNGKWQNQAGMWILNSKPTDSVDEDDEGTSNSYGN